MLYKTVWSSQLWLSFFSQWSSLQFYSSRFSTTTETLRYTPYGQHLIKVLGLIVIPRSPASLFFKVLTLIVITSRPAHFVKTVQVHVSRLLQYEQSSATLYL